MAGAGWTLHRGPAGSLWGCISRPKIKTDINMTAPRRGVLMPGGARCMMLCAGASVLRRRGLQPARLRLEFPQEGVDGCYGLAGSVRFGVELGALK